MTNVPLFFFFFLKKDYGKQVEGVNITEDIAVLGQFCAEVVPLPSTYTKCSCRVTSTNYGNFFIDFYLRLKKSAQFMFIIAIRSNRCQETVSCLGSFSQISSGSTSHNNVLVISPVYLSNELERVQKRAMRIIFPLCSYNEALVESGLTKLSNRRQELVDKLFKNVLQNEQNKLHELLPARNTCTFNLRNMRKFKPAFKTNRFRSSFITFNALKA